MGYDCAASTSIYSLMEQAPAIWLLNRKDWTTRLMCTFPEQGQYLT
jgi:hypothetical protein